VKTIIIKTAPISVNRLYQGRRFLTSEGKSIKNKMAWEAKSQWKKEPLKGDIALNVLFYFKDKRMLDIDGGLKALFDCLTGIIWVDDKQITELHAFKEVDKSNPRVELQIV
jgi:Holliday junction resolvase RusA-like endonuclease